MLHYTYILRCCDGSYYVGHTDRLPERIQEHQIGAIEGHTKTRRPVRLVYSEAFDTKNEAFQRERQLKGWSRAKKEALINRNPDRLQFLSRNYTDAMAKPTSTSSVRVAR